MQRSLSSPEAAPGDRALGFAVVLRFPVRAAAGGGVVGLGGAIFVDERAFEVVEPLPFTGDELDVDVAARLEVGVYIAPAIAGEVVVDPLGDVQDWPT